MFYNNQLLRGFQLVNKGLESSGVEFLKWVNYLNVPKWEYATHSDCNIFDKIDAQFRDRSFPVVPITVILLERINELTKLKSYE